MTIHPDQPSGGISRRKFLERSAALSLFFIVPRHVLGGKGFVAPSDRINIGFIGAGRQAISLQKSFLSTAEARIVAASDVYASKVESFVAAVNAFHAKEEGKATYNGCSGHADFRAILANKDVDAVVIATPDHWHAVQAVLAAEAGKDIYCEKPLSLTIKEGRAMVHAARRHKRVFQTGSMQRSMPEFQQAVSLIRNGYIGDLTNIKVSVGGPPVPLNLPAENLVPGLDWNAWLGPNEAIPFNNQLNPALGDKLWARWRDFKGWGGGGMTDWGAHMFDIAQWAMNTDDSGPVQITPPNGKDHPFLTYQYSNGVVMTHEDFGKRNAIQFNGTKGSIEVQRGKLVTTPTELATRVLLSEKIQIHKNINHYKDFLQCMRTREKPICDVEIGHRTATVCNLGNIAYELNRPLHWNPRKEKFRGDREANALRGRQLRKEWSIRI